MAIKDKKEIEILDSISKSLKEISLFLADIRHQLTSLNIDGLVKLVDIITEDRKQIKKIISKKEREKIDKRPEDLKWVLSKIYQAFRYGGFFNCEICNRNSFIIAQNGHKVCDECLDNYIRKGISIEKAKEIYKQQR